ncbi:hypothetical protein B484DRAFT_422626 [Ochromonadaceae sp. CCMP2298]|nr:hypothetical protein B484DRAFT_422626 [Ochromonadaceae sp. CCMP2298]
MDNFGFGNWNNDDSYDSSPNKDYNRKGAKRGGKTQPESFDFDISTDFGASPVQRSVKDRRAAVAESTNSNSRFGGPTRRSSIEDRTKEILERNKNVGKSEAEEDNTRAKSYEDTFAELMDGLDPSKYQEEKSPRNPNPDLSRASLHSPLTHHSQSFSRLDSSLESPTGGDSLEISATDLEVGALAARRAKEKASDRRRRQSLDTAPHITTLLDQSSLSRKEGPMHAKIASSPELMKKRRGDQDPQFSSALSSIQRSLPADEGAKAANEFARFGSMGRSDDDIYQMLNVTQGTHESIKFGESKSGAPSGRSAGMGAGAGAGTGAGMGAGAELMRKSNRGEQGYMSDMTQGSREEEEEDPYSRDVSAPEASRPSLGIGMGGGRGGVGSGVGGVGGERRGGAMEDEDSDKSMDKSMDSDQATSPNAPNPAMGQGQGQGKASNSRYEEEEGDDYSLDDFDEDPASPERARPPHSPLSPLPKGPSPQPSTPPSPTPKSMSLMAPIPIQRTNSFPAAGLNSVEEIMQRWYSADSEFISTSLQKFAPHDPLSPVAEDRVSGEKGGRGEKGKGEHTRIQP